MSPTVLDAPAIDDTVEIQERAAGVLLQLLAAKHLPAATWKVCAYTPGILEGQITQPGQQHLVPGLIAEWAEVFGAEVTANPSRPDRDDPFTIHAMTTRIDGIEVRVWGLVDDAGKDAV